MVTLAAALALAASAFLSSSAAALDPTRPLVLVHGHEGDSGADCTWGNLMKKFRAWYPSWGIKGGPFIPVRYYVDDAVCPQKPDYGPMLSLTIDHHGSHTASQKGHVRDLSNQQDPFHQPGERTDLSHTNNTPIGHLARHFAWYIYDHFTSKGVPVNVVAHSMGGLIVRYAIDAVQRRKSGFPPVIVIPSVVTFGTPHDGITLGPFSFGCKLFGGDSDQCREMDRSSSFIEYLRDNARNPQGAYGTWWSVAGSHADGSVDEGSAISMSVKYKMRWASEVSIEHKDYMNERLDDDPPSEIGAHCWSTGTGASYGNQTEGKCYWPLQWSFTLLTWYGY